MAQPNLEPFKRRGLALALRAAANMPVVPSAAANGVLLFNGTSGTEFDKVERPARVRIRYLNRDGEQVEEEASGLYAVCIQHEMDHLNGVLFIDHLSRLKRERAVTKVKKAARERIAA